MEYNIDDKNYRIEAKGSEKEIKKFARCLVETINKHYLGEFDLHKSRVASEPVQYNPTAYERIYLSNNSLLYLPNINEENGKKFHFNILMIHYKKAREKFEKISESF